MHIYHVCARVCVCMRKRLRGRLLNHLEEEERYPYSKSSPILHPCPADTDCSGFFPRPGVPCSDPQDCPKRQWPSLLSPLPTR